MERIAASLRDKIKSVEEAAALIQSGSVIGCSGFTLVGEPKAVPHELARQKKADHLTILTGASVGDALDGELTRAGLLSMRYPYQSNKSMRNAINAGEVGYSDMHLSHMPEFINRGGLHIDFALVECAAIGAHIISFLKEEVAAGRQPASLSPIQSGVGSVANAVLAGLGSSGFTGLRMYTEVVQDSALELIWEGKMAGASTTAVSLSQKKLELFYENIDFFRERLVIRPQEIANNPELVRRLGLISMNTPIECDLYGNVNSTHIMGNKMMNGIGGSGDFARNAGLTIFATASVAKEGAISCIVPMCSHIDHTEHDVQVIVTEQGLADLRWKSPRQRAELIVERCAHPQYRPLLREYLKDAAKYGGHTPHNLQQALSWHTRYLDTGTMLPG